MCCRHPMMMAWTRILPLRTLTIMHGSSLTSDEAARLVTSLAASCRRRVILMAWRAQGKSRRLTWAAFRVRVSMRPCPVSRAEMPAGTCRQGAEP